MNVERAAFSPAGRDEENIFGPGAGYVPSALPGPPQHRLFPKNFVVRNGTLYYIDFECSEYMEHWNFEHWEIKYWSKTSEFMRDAKEHS